MKKRAPYFRPTLKRFGTSTMFQALLAKLGRAQVQNIIVFPNGSASAVTTLGAIKFENLNQIILWVVRSN
jgi:hypothetical protein